MIYKSVVGSRSYDLAIPTSDVDISKVVLSDSSNSILISSLSEFISDMFGPNPRWFFTQFLFPESFIQKDDLSELYQTIKRRADRLSMFPDASYKVDPKRLAYGTFFYSMLANYADGMPFEKAHRPEGYLHDLLIRMRLGQIPVNEAINVNFLERKRAEQSIGFYKESGPKNILEDFRNLVNNTEALHFS